MSGTIEINKDKRPSQMLSLEALEERIGYVFQDKKLLRRAVTHRSFAQEHNERLEFLGDSVLNCVIGYALFLRDKHFNEGELSRVRANLVCEKTLHEIALKIDVSSFLYMGEGEVKTGGAHRASILADAMEAIFGAVFREAGFDAVEVHAGHGYLISQFLSPYTNHRKDEYGGSLENRMRFMTMVMNEVMKAAGKDLAVFVKMNMRDGFRGGMEIEETLEVARRLESLGAHALVLSGGFVSKAPMYVMRGAMPIKTLTHYMDCWWLKFGVKLAGRMMIPTVPFKEAYFLEDALKFRSEIKIPLIYVGGLVSREKIDEVLNEGFEAVQMARALLNEPGFVNRMRREEKARCNCGHSNYCIGRMYTIEMACHRHLTEELPLCLKKEIEQLENK